MEAVVNVAKGVLMGREQYNIFSEDRIGKISLPNRLVRSATWDGIRSFSIGGKWGQKFRTT